MMIDSLNALLDTLMRVAILLGSFTQQCGRYPKASRAWPSKRAIVCMMPGDVRRNRGVLGTSCPSGNHADVRSYRPSLYVFATSLGVSWSAQPLRIIACRIEEIGNSSRVARSNHCASLVTTSTCNGKSCMDLVAKSARMVFQRIRDILSICVRLPSIPNDSARVAPG